MPIRVSIAASKASLPNKQYTKDAEKRYTDLVKRAFLAWSTAADGRLTFEFVANPSDAQINCEWTNNPMDRAYSFELGHCGVIAGGIWKSTKLRALTFIGSEFASSDSVCYNVCLHEISGHALGLEHSVHPQDVMYFSIEPQNGLCKFAVLSQNDIARIRELYAYPSQPRELALQFCSAAFVRHDYEAAYQLLSSTERLKKSLEEFEESLEREDSGPKVESIDIHSMYGSYRQSCNGRCYRTKPEK